MFRKINLHLFDEGAESGATAPVAGESSIVEGGSTENSPSEMSFDEFIKAHEDEYKKHVEGIVKQRIKDSKRTKESLERANKALERFASKYKVDTNDHEGIIKAIENDESILEEEALERGISVDMLQYEKQIQSENATMKAEIERLRSQQAEAKKMEIVRQWDAQAQALRKVYPNFDLKTEIQNETFQRLIAIPGLSMQDAYEVLHRNERDNKVAGDTAHKVAQSIASKGTHPNENGARSQQAIDTHTDISKLTKAEINDYVMRARRGERITFT